jgi:hypothetical protein
MFMENRRDLGEKDKVRETRPVRRTRKVMETKEVSKDGQ